jgi:hypothetical protein
VGDRLCLELPQCLQDTGESFFRALLSPFGVSFQQFANIAHHTFEFFHVYYFFVPNGQTAIGLSVVPAAATLLP